MHMKVIETATNGLYLYNLHITVKFRLLCHWAVFRFRFIVEIWSLHLKSDLNTHGICQSAPSIGKLCDWHDIYISTNATTNSEVFDRSKRFELGIITIFCGFIFFSSNFLSTILFKQLIYF